MKVAIVANPFSKIPAAKYGGTETVIYHSIKGLIEAGHEPILIGTGDSEVDCRVIPIVQKAEFYPRNPALVRTYRSESGGSIIAPRESSGICFRKLM
jgi:hypothetical protein